MSALSRGNRVAVAVGLLGALATPAGAAAAPVSDSADDIVVSSDGIGWGPELSAPLFDPAIRWVPGDVRTSSFYVRNDGDTSAILRIEGRDAVTGELTDQGVVALYARADGGRWQPLRMGAMSGQLDVAALDVGRVARVEVRGTFESEADNRTQDQEADLEFVVRLEDASAAGADAGPGAPAPTGALPGVGAPEVTVPLVAGVGLVGAGLALVARKRVRRG